MHSHLRRVEVVWRQQNVRMHLVAHAEHVLMKVVLLHLDRQLARRNERLQPLFELQERLEDRNRAFLIFYSV